MSCLVGLVLALILVLCRAVLCFVLACCRFGYHDASCFGHALEGNLHLVFSQVGRHRRVCRQRRMCGRKARLLCTPRTGPAVSL